MKRKYYEAELAYLLEEGRDFALAFPSSAPFLQERGSDPHIERLLEGVAFLAARIRERIDDSVPEFAHQFTSMLVPALSSFVPPAGVLQFHPERAALRAPKNVPRGGEVAGVTSTGCRGVFRTSRDVRLLPLHIADVVTTRPATHRARIAIHFRTAPHFGAALADEELVLFLHGAVPFWSTLSAWFVHHCARMRVMDGDTVLKETRTPKIEALGWKLEEEALWPLSSLEHDAFRPVAELFALPEKHAFIRLPKLGVKTGGEFQLVFDFDRPPKLPKPAIHNDIRLHCTPIVNLFEASAEPLRISVEHPEHRLRPQGLPLDQCEVWGVSRVREARSGAEYPNFADFRADRGEKFYSVRVASSSLGSGTDSYLTLHTSRDSKPLLESEILAIDLLCTNRAEASSFSPGSVKTATRTTGTSVPFENITTISAPGYRARGELLWRLAAHLGASRRGLQSAANLRRLLGTYISDSESDSKTRIAQLWLESIRDVNVRSVVRLVRGAPVSGTSVKVRLDESKFAAQGEAVLLGAVLNEVYARKSRINSCSLFSVELSPSNIEYAWPARNGLLIL